MRMALLLLLLANVGFFGWSRHLSMAGVSPENHLLQQQINRDAIRLLPSTQMAELASRSACIEWGAIGLGDLSKAEELLSRVLPGSRFSERRAEEAAAYWVFLPAAPTRQAAQQKTAELKRLGVNDFFVVQDEARFRFAISLGVFRTEEGARKRLEQLREQGVRTAQMRPRDTPMQQVYFQLGEVPADARGKLAELRQGFPGTELKPCGSGSLAAAR